LVARLSSWQAFTVFCWESATLGKAKMPKSAAPIIATI
jgi:hypothetical protein